VSRSPCLACTPALDTSAPTPAGDNPVIQAGEVPPDTTRMRYPATAMGPVVDDYHGEQIADPYRWLEELDTPDTRAWVEAQNKLTFGYLGEIKEREQLRARLTKLWNFERYGLPVREGGRVFYSKNDGLQNQSVMYVTDSPTPRRACCSTRTRCRPTAPSRCRAPRSARTASCSPTAWRAPAPTGRSGTSATSRPARTCPTCLSG
jgi:hypothetical protein